MNMTQGITNAPTSDDKSSSGVSSGSDLEIKSIPVQDQISNQSSRTNQQSNNQKDIQTSTELNLPELQVMSNPSHKIEKESGREESAENHNFKANLAGFNSSIERDIEQILFFYTDKTFHIYKPS